MSKRITNIGEFRLGDYPKRPDLWILDNPPSNVTWGVKFADGRVVCPPDRFVTDLGSTRQAWAWLLPILQVILWFIPPTLAKRAFCWHDFGYHCIRETHRELYAELESWFNWMGLGVDQRIQFINWLKYRPKSEWDKDLLDLMREDGVRGWRIKAAYYGVVSFGWLALRRRSSGKTRALRRVYSTHTDMI